MKHAGVDESDIEEVSASKRSRLGTLDMHDVCGYLGASNKAATLMVAQLKRTCIGRQTAANVGQETDLSACKPPQFCALHMVPAGGYRWCRKAAALKIARRRRISNLEADSRKHQPGDRCISVQVPANSRSAHAICW